MDSFDRVLALAGSLVVLLAVFSAADATTAEVHPAEPPPYLPPLTDAVLPAAAPGFDTSRLPAGVTIDPETLQLVGLNLEAEAGGGVASWGVLGSFQYVDGLDELPEALAALDGQTATMAGFLLPLYEYEDIKEFHLVASHWSCCFGVPPGLNGWVAIRLAPGQPGLPNTTDPVKVTGTFRVREEKEAGYVVAIYAIDDARATILR